MEKIFVSIASYRDVQCSETLESLFSNARHPSRIYVGICQQNMNNNADEKCLKKDNFPYKKNIKIIQKKHTDAKGPTYARYICSTLYNNEDYFFQIDSHCLFVEHWDVKCIKMIKDLERSSEIKNKKVMLSHYPPSYDSYEKKPSNTFVTHMVDCYFNGDGMLTFHGAKWKEPGALPRRNAFLAAGFIFTRGSWVKEVPFDPDLNFLFTGEEILLSVRSFTSGWDVYTPNQNILFHAYTRQDSPKFWTDITYDNNDVKQKVKIITGLDSDISKLQSKTMLKTLKDYNIGGIRTLDEFYKFIGVDVKNKTVGKPMVEFYQSSHCWDDGNQIICFLMIVLLLLFVFS